MNRVILKLLALTALTALAVMPAFGESSPAPSLTAHGSHVLTKIEVEKLLSGARISLADTDGATRSWIHGLRGNLIASLTRPSTGASRAVNGQGTARIDQNGAYCVRIEWPSTLESWCRRIFSLNGGYYAVSDDAAETPALPVQIVQPNPGRLSTLGRLWYLARLGSGATAR
jgi:hypothetical protein